MEITINIYIKCNRINTLSRRRREAYMLAKKLDADDVILRELDEPAPESRPEGFEIVEPGRLRRC